MELLSPAPWGQQVSENPASWGGTGSRQEEELTMQTQWCGVWVSGAAGVLHCVVRADFTEEVREEAAGLKWEMPRALGDQLGEQSEE